MLLSASIPSKRIWVYFSATFLTFEFMPKCKVANHHICLQYSSVQVQPIETNLEKIVF